MHSYVESDCKRSPLNAPFLRNNHAKRKARGLQIRRLRRGHPSLRSKKKQELGTMVNLSHLAHDLSDRLLGSYCYGARRR